MIVVDVVVMELVLVILNDDDGDDERSEDDDIVVAGFLVVLPEEEKRSSRSTTSTHSFVVVVVGRKYLSTLVLPMMLLTSSPIVCVCVCVCVLVYSLNSSKHFQENKKSLWPCPWVTYRAANPCSALRLQLQCNIDYVHGKNGGRILWLCSIYYSFFHFSLLPPFITLISFFSLTGPSLAKCTSYVDCETMAVTKTVVWCCLSTVLHGKNQSMVGKV